MSHVFNIFSLLLIITVVSSSKNFEEGIDVSYLDGNIDWAKVRASGITFAFVQSSIGDSADDAFLKNWRGIKDNGIKALAYHSLIVNQTAKSQADQIKKVLKQSDFSESKDVIAIQVEEFGNGNATKEQFADRLSQVIQLLESASFKNIAIHTGQYFWKQNVAFGKYDFGKYALWVGHFSREGSERFMNIPDTWKDKGYQWWRYNYFGKVDGIKGNANLNRSNGTKFNAQDMEILNSF